MVSWCVSPCFSDEQSPHLAADARGRELTVGVRWSASSLSHADKDHLLAGVVVEVLVVLGEVPLDFHPCLVLI